MDKRDADALLERIDACNAAISALQRDLFGLILHCERAEVWVDSGARDLAHWLGMRYGISEWRAHRWIDCAKALEHLPLTAAAFASGELSIDKVVELTRFATPDTEARLLRWAGRVWPAAIRRRADVLAHQDIEATREAERGRRLTWSYFDEERRFGLTADLPSADGAIVARALDRIAATLPDGPDDEEDEGRSVDARRADALVALASTRLAADADSDRATVVLHAQLDGLMAGTHGCELEDGAVVHPQVARRLACNGRVQLVVEDESGQAVGIGRTRREPTAAMLRHLRYRDFGCTFPGCGARRFTQAHHIVWWERGGRTDLDNLVLVCFFHHKLVHEMGWSLARGPDGEISWFRPDGSRYRAGPDGSELEESVGFG
jgi:hypothetical protein